jgi:hypothetical protein
MHHHIQVSVSITKKIQIFIKLGINNMPLEDTFPPCFIILNINTETDDMQTSDVTEQLESKKNCLVIGLKK